MAEKLNFWQMMQKANLQHKKDMPFTNAMNDVLSHIIPPILLGLCMAISISIAYESYGTEVHGKFFPLGIVLTFILGAIFIGSIFRAGFFLHPYNPTDETQGG